MPAQQKRFFFAITFEQNASSEIHKNPRKIEVRTLIFSQKRSSRADVQVIHTHTQIHTQEDYRKLSLCKLSASDAISFTSDTYQGKPPLVLKLNGAIL